MNHKNQISEELLFQYIEDKESGTANLSINQINDIENQLSNDAQLQSRAEDITEHIRLLRNLPHPPIPEQLASRCLESIKSRNEPNTTPIQWKWAYAGALAALVIFITGVWLGRQSSSHQSTFQQLADIQTTLISRLESSLAQHYGEDALSEENPWHTPMMNVKLTSQAITTAHQEHSGDPVIDRGLSLAVAQNIKVLQSLCEYIESNKDIPDRDFQFISASSDLTESAI